MSTLEEFENAPVGSIATNKNTGAKAVKVIEPDGYGWFANDYSLFENQEIVKYSYELDPLPILGPKTAEEALELVWELAQEVSPGTIIPEGTDVVRSTGLEDGSFRIDRLISDFSIAEGEARKIRVIRPLLEKEPEWLSSPAVMAYHSGHYRELSVWVPHLYSKGLWINSITGKSFPWRELQDVRPLCFREES